ncbi:MAG: hypothetical protein ABIB46_00535 [bacterium]
MNKILYWTPRILAILFNLFIAMFVLDVFSEYKFPEVLIALFMHLVPNFILGLITLIAWKKEKIGGILFILLAFFYIIMTFGKDMGGIITYLIITGPLIVIGILFILSKLIHR